MATEQGSGVRDVAASLRAAMVEELRGDPITSELVAAAVATVPRHLFTPGVPLEAAYASNDSVVVKRAPDGTSLSSVSAAHIQAAMLEQAGIARGMRVLEVGSGGYNAALIQELVGDQGRVVSVDIDPEIVARARACLAAAGYDQVEVVLADAEHGAPDGTVHDRIVVTAGSWDIPPAWVAQLAERGRLVVPLRLRGLTRSIAFDRDGEGLISRGYRLSAFVPMQGSGAFGERVVPVDDEVSFHLDELREFDLGALRAAVHAPPLLRWSGAAFDLPDELELFLMTSAPMVLLHAGPRLVEQGRFAASTIRGVPALVDGGSFAYRTKRPDEDTGGFESGVIAHGPDADAVASRYVDLLRRWASDYRRRGAARIRYLPKANEAAGVAPGFIPKRHGAVTVTWP